MRCGGGSVRQGAIGADGIRFTEQRLKGGCGGSMLPSVSPNLSPISSPIPKAAGRPRKRDDNLLSDIRVHGDVAYVTLTKGYVATIDANDAELVGQYNWIAMVRDQGVYARSAKTTDGKRVAIFLHRLVLGLPDGSPETGDHRDGDGLNNRKRNLRIADQSQQMRNRSFQSCGGSAYRGVFWNKARKRWIAKATIAGRRRYLGLFKTEAEASHAYEYVSKIVYGDFYREPIGHNAKAPLGPPPKLAPLVVKLLAELNAAAQRASLPSTLTGAR